MRLHGLALIVINVKLLHGAAETVRRPLSEKVTLYLSWFTNDATAKARARCPERWASLRGEYDKAFEQARVLAERRGVAAAIADLGASVGGARADEVFVADDGDFVAACVNWGSKLDSRLRLLHDELTGAVAFLVRVGRPITRGDSKGVAGCARARAQTCVRANTIYRCRRT